jgi:hypothetical protein
VRALVLALASTIAIVATGVAEAAAEVTCHDRAATIVGTPGNDRIVGTPRRDIISSPGRRQPHFADGAAAI